MKLRLLTVSLLCVGLAVPIAGAAASPSGSGTRPVTERAVITPSTVAMTKITISVRGCLGRCSLGAHNDRAVAHHGAPWKAAPTKVTWSHGIGTFTFLVPRYRTRGMYFDFYDPKAGRTDADTIVVVRYRGTKVGAAVTTRTAHRFAAICWAGTTRSSVTRAVSVGHFRAPNFPSGHVVTMDRPFFVRALQNLDAFTATWHGQVGAQDYVTC